MIDDRKAWEIMKDMVIELEHGTEDFSNPKLLKTVIERAMDVIEVATAVAMLAKDGIPALATMEQLQEAVAAFDDLSKPPMAQEESLPPEPEVRQTIQHYHHGDAVPFILERMMDMDRPHKERFPEDLIEEGCICRRLIENVLDWQQVHIEQRDAASDAEDTPAPR